MSKRVFFACSLLLVAVLVRPAPAERTPLDGIVALVDDEAIFRSDVEIAVKQYMLQQGMTSLPDAQRVELAQKVLEDLINDRLVIAQAARLGIDVEFSEVEERVNRAIDENKKILGGASAFEAQLAREGFTMDELKQLYRRQIRNQMLVERVLQMEMASQRQADVGEAELRKFYEENLSRLPTRPAVVHLKTIFIGFQTSSSATAAAREKIEAIRRRATSGEPFADLARELSEDPSASQGGDLGFIKPEDLREPAFADAAGKLDIGEISDPVLTAYGYHILQVTERRAETGEVRLRHILVRIAPSNEDMQEVFDTARAIHEQIVAGAPFDTLANRYNTDPTAGPGGDLGWLKVEDLPEFFQDVLAGMVPGDVSQVLRESAGFRIVKLLEREDARPYDYSEVKTELRRLYDQERMGSAYDEYVASLRDKFTVDIKQ